MAWIAILAFIARGEISVSPAPWQVAQMLFWAGWLPTITTACWQVKHRSWHLLLLSDLLSTGCMIAIACTVYIPLFFFNVVWFLFFSLLPRGCLTQLLMRLAV
jgi:hypothetical protein